VIPTLGRPTLARTVFSFIDQLEDGDEVLLVADPKGDPEYVRFVHRGIVAKKLGVHSSVRVERAPGGWGHPQRNHGVRYALGSRIWCIADDDVATAHALQAIRLSIEEDDPWTIFRAGRGEEVAWVWQDPNVRVGNLDADCIVCPSDVRSQWGLDYEGDVKFARALVEELGPPVFRPEIVAVTNPSEAYLERHYAGLINGW